MRFVVGLPQERDVLSHQSKQLAGRSFQVRPLPCVQHSGVAAAEPIKSSFQMVSLSLSRVAQAGLVEQITARAGASKS